MKKNNGGSLEKGYIMPPLLNLLLQIS